ncbi:MAG: adenylate/guanylate cyclase domain-containing protein [Patescibacteria group bacterium]|nr:adenylate/guanylate cyclase domain-containing protein [Patescibacteria group bacterium]
MKNKIIASIGIAVATTFILSIFAYFGVGETWHLKLSDGNFTRNEPSEEIVIVAIDPKSTSDQGLGRFYDWSRSYYAQVLDNIGKYNPKAVGIDLLFFNKSRGIDDKTLIDLYTNTKSAEDFAKQTSEYIKKDHPDDIKFAQSIEKAGNVVLAGVDVNGEVAKSIPLLTTAAKDTGLVNAMPDDDGIVRRVPLKNSLISKIAHLSEILVPQEDELIINYAAEPYQYKRISFVDAYNGDFGESAVKGKIVLIGPTDLSLQDVQFTPNAKTSPMPGVEVHANAIQTLIEGNVLSEQRFSNLATVLLVTALVAVVAFILLNIPLGIVAALVLMIAYTAAARYMFDKNVIWNMLYPYAAIILAYISTMIYRYWTEFKEKRFVSEAFGHYVSPEIVKELQRDPKKLKVGGENKVLTVMFTDIENFTTYSEKMTPEQITGLINEYMEYMTEIVLQNGGTLDKYEGDAIMAFFGAPIEQDDHAYRACKTALEMLKALPNLHQKWQAEGKPLLNFRAGIATGEVLVGNMGSRKRFDYTVMGDTVNLAARLEPANKEFNTRIMVNEKTARMCQGRLNFKELGEIKVKGKEDSVKVYTITSPQSSPVFPEQKSLS